MPDLASDVIIGNALFEQHKSVTFKFNGKLPNLVVSLILPIVQLESYHHHITCWIWYFPRRRSWPDFVWSLSLLFLAISFDHMHPLSPLHFSSSHSLPAFSTFVSVFLFLYYHSLQISKPSLSHFHLLSSKHDRTTVDCLL